MVRITFIEHNGDQITVDAKPGQSMMQAAVNNGVKGIAADCGGNCACGTCRVYVEEAWKAKLPAPKGDELGMIEYSGDRHAGVRLSCQIPVKEELDGIVVRLPANQHY